MEGLDRAALAQEVVERLALHHGLAIQKACAMPGMWRRTSASKSYKIKVVTLLSTLDSCADFQPP